MLDWRHQFLYRSMTIDLYFFWMSTWCLCDDDGTAANSYDLHKHIDGQVQRLGDPARDWASQCQRRLPPVPEDLWRPLHRGISLHLLLEIYPNPLTFVSSDRSLLCYDASLRVRRQATFTSGSAPTSPDVLVLYCIVLDLLLYLIWILALKQIFIIFFLTRLGRVATQYLQLCPTIASAMQGDHFH